MVAPMGVDLKRHITAFKQLDEKRVTEGLSDKEEADWLAAKQAIEGAWGVEEPAPSSGRLRDEGSPSELEVTFEHAGDFARAYLRNTADGGVYVNTDKLFDMGDRFNLRVSVDDPTARFEMNVQVVWVNRTPSAGSGLEPGVGVAWLDMTPDKKNLIKSIVYGVLDELS